MRTPLVIALATLAASASAPAQPVAQPPADGACTYDTCALRVEGAFFRGYRLVRGPVGAGEDVGGVGILGGGLADATAQVPAAYDHARRAGRYRIGSVVTGVAGGVALAVSLPRLTDVDAFGREPDGLQTAVYLGGAVLAIVSGALQLKAANEQSRALWEYNRAVAATPPVE